MRASTPGARRSSLITSNSASIRRRRCRRATARRSTRRSARRSRRSSREVVSFHFGLPEAALLKRVKAAGCMRHELGHHGRRGALAGSARLRRGDRARLRGRRPSRHVPDRQSGGAGRHLRAGAAGRRCRESAGDRGRRHHRRARHRRRRSRSAPPRVQIGTRLSVLPGIRRSRPPHRAALESRARRRHRA